MKAFKFSALDYLLKPTDAKGLMLAAQKAERSFGISQQQLDLLRQQMQTAPPFPEKFALPYVNGVILVELKNIICRQADDNYSFFHLVN